MRGMRCCAPASLSAGGTRRGSERGTARPEVLQELLKTTERVVQEIDSVEYGLTDIQEYYGAMSALRASRMDVCARRGTVRSGYV
jgi:cobalamin biosynthesis Mg chelatase CobN